LHDKGYDPDVGLLTCGYLLELEDGTRLEPIKELTSHKESSGTIVTKRSPIADFEMEDGKQVFIQYEPLESVSICMAGKTVWVTCITDVTP
jgi:hypothetical protein